MPMDTSRERRRTMRFARLATNFTSHVATTTGGCPPAAFVARAENRAVTIPWTMARATFAFGRYPGLRVVALARAFPDCSSGWPSRMGAVLALLAAYSCRESRGLRSILPHRVPI